MAKLDLNHGDRALLILLMTIGTEVANADLNKTYGVDLKTDRRDKLDDMGLISVRRPEGRPKGPISLALTAAGREAVMELLMSPPAPGGGLQVAATYALLAQAGRYLAQAGATPAAFFEARTVAVDLDSEAIEERIHKAYARLAQRPGQWVTLTALRELLGAIPRHQVDAVLVLMNRTPSVTIVPEANQKMLTPADREAAVIIGNQPKHAIAIGHR